MNHLAMGASVAFAGVFTEQMTSPGADLPLSASEISWICSVTSIGNMLGYLISSYVNPMFGAIRVCQLCAPLVAGGYLMVAFGDNFWILLAGRLVSGIFNGVTTGPTNTHIGEISSVGVRGFLTTSMITIGGVWDHVHVPHRLAARLEEDVSCNGHHADGVDVRPHAHDAPLAEVDYCQGTSRGGGGAITAVLLR